MSQEQRVSPGGVKLLQEPQLAHFTTLMNDGTPQTTPVWVDVEPDGSHVLINTASGRLKTENVERDPRVSVSVVDKRNDWRWLVVRGRVVEARTEGAAEHIDKLAKKYLGKDRYPNHTPSEQRVILRIQPERVLEQGTQN